MPLRKRLMASCILEIHLAYRKGASTISEVSFTIQDEENARIGEGGTEAGAFVDRGSSPGDRNQRRFDSRGSLRALRDRFAYLQMGCLGRENDPSADGGGA